MMRYALPFTVVVLSACTLGPDFHRPDPPAVQAYIAPDESLAALNQTGAPQRATDEIPAEWWTAFKSPSLDALMRESLAGNRSLQAAAAKLISIDESVKAASGASYPQLTMDAGAGRQKYGAQFGGEQVFPAFTYFSLGPSVSYLIDYTGGQHRAVEQQQALANTQRWQFQAAQLSITGSVAAQALALAAAQAQIDAVQTLLEEDQRNLQLVQSAFEAGSRNRVDVLSAQSQYDNDQTLLPPLRQQLSMARHALAILVGKSPGDWTPPDFKLDDLQLPQSLPIGVPSELAHRRPDILAAEAQLHAATAAVGVATARLYPQINLTASASQQATQLSNLFDASSTAWGLAAALTAPVFDGGTLRAERRAAVADAQASLASYEQTLLVAFGQVADVLTALNHDAEALAAEDRALTTADASLKLTRESFSAGNVGVLEVLDAERRDQQARLGEVRARAQRYQDSAQLFLALGGNTPQD